MTAAEPRALERRVFQFEGRTFPAVKLRDAWWFPARHYGRALEQGDDGKRFVRNATTGAAQKGVEFIRVRGKELAAVIATLSEGANSAPSLEGGAREMVLLSESGLWHALMRSRTEIGKRLVLWVSREVLPALYATRTYTVPGAAPALPAPDEAALVRAQETALARNFLTVESRAREIERLCAKVADAVPGRWGAERRASWARQMVCMIFGVAGLEAGAYDAQTFWKMRAALDALVAGFVVLPGRSRRAAARALPQPGARLEQLTLFGLVVPAGSTVQVTVAPPR